MSRAPKSIRQENIDYGRSGPDIIRGAKNNDIEEVRAALLDNPDDITKQDVIFHMSALHYAATLCNPSMVNFLLEQKGIDIFLNDKWGRDPLDAAILAGNAEIIDAMFQFRQKLSGRNVAQLQPPS